MNPGDDGLTFFLRKVSDYEGRMVRGTVEVIMSLPSAPDAPFGLGGLSAEEVRDRSGRVDRSTPTVAFVVETPDGRAVFAETSLRLFIDIAKAFRLKYGDPE
jgi:hypothetical protein